MIYLILSSHCTTECADGADGAGGGTGAADTLQDRAGATPGRLQGRAGAADAAALKHMDVNLQGTMYKGAIPRPSSTVRRAGGEKVSQAHLDLNRTPYVVYGVKYIDLESLVAIAEPEGMSSGAHLDFSRAPYVLYGVQYTDLASLASLAREKPLRFKEFLAVAADQIEAQLQKDFTKTHREHRVKVGAMFGFPCL